MTPPELALWIRLRARQPGCPIFRRQHPVGPYILDFYCSAARLAVEVDGECHLHGGQAQRDEARDVYLAERGVHVVRYTAADVLRDADDVADSIFRTAAAPPQSSASPPTAPPFLGGAEGAKDPR